MPAETPMHPTKLNFDSILLPTASTRVRNHAHSATADTRVWDHERDNATSTPPPHPPLQWVGEETHPRT
jgi:hypothetical protein